MVFSLCFSLGGHWMLLQAVAWTGMLISYSNGGSFVEAVEKTFDGEHPCPMCKRIAQERKQEKQRADMNLVSKLDLKFVLPAARPAPVPVFSMGAWERVDFTAPVLTNAPPVPPPRAV